MKVYLRVAKRLLTEPHLPRPLRWLLVLGLLPMPGPVDEVALVLAALLIAVFYRPRFKDLLEEERGRMARRYDAVPSSAVGEGGLNVQSPRATHGSCSKSL